MDFFRIFRTLLLTLLVVCVPLAAQTVDTMSVTITYTGSSGANTASVHVSNATNVSARIGTNITSTGTLVSGAGDTPGVFLQNVSDNGPSTALVNIGTNSSILGALARLGATTYTGATLLISATGCTDCISVSLTLQITSGGTVSITYNGAAIPSSGISLFTSAGGVVSAQIALSSTLPTSFTISSNQPWLTPNPTTGTLSGSQSIGLTLNAAGLPVGANTAILTVAAGGISTNITVTLNVGTGGGLTLSPNPLNFTYVTSSSSFSTGQTQYVTLSGPSALATYSATATSNPPWLLVGSSGGTTVGGLPVSAQLPVSVNPAVLNLSTATTYTGTVVVTTSDGLSSTLNVNLTVTASGTGANTTLTFSVATVGGASPPAQTITISGSGNYFVSTLTNNCNQGWISVTPNNGPLSSVPTSISVTVLPGNNGAGTCTGTISISDSGGVLQNGTNLLTVNVNMVIGNGGSGGGGAVASPAALTFTIPSGVTQSQQIIVNGDGTGFTAQAIGTNLSVIPTTGNTPAILTVTAGSTSSSGTIIITSSLGTQNVGVTMNVLQGNVFYSTSNPASLAYIYQPGGALSNQNLSINASGDASGNNLNFSVASAPAFVAYATTTAVTPSAIGAGITTSKLAPGFNSGNIVLTATGNAANPNLTIPVTVLAPGSTPGLIASPTSVNLSAQQFSGPVSQTVSISGLSGTTISATAISTGNWLAVTPNSATSPATLTITANPATLAAQATPYPGTVMVTAANGTNLTILVNLTVSTTGPSNPVLSVTGGPLTFNYQTGGAAPAAQIIQVSTTNGSTAYNAMASVNWINISPAAGNTPGTLSITLNTSLLNQGSQTGTITITAPGATNSPQTVMVTANVTTPPMLTLNATSTTFPYRTGDPAPASQTVQVGSTGGALSFSLSVTNAPWLTITPTNGTTPATLTLSVDPTKVQVGSYSATVTISSPSAASLTLMVQFNVSAPLPTITDVLNGATNQSGPISPGLVIVIPGSFIGSDPQTNFVLNGDVLATTVANTRVKVGGYLAPVIFASSTLVAAIVPYEIAGKTSTFVEVDYLGQSSNDMTVQVAGTAPGVFTPQSPALPGPAPVAGAVLNQDGSVNSESNTASSGQTVTVLATGEGQTVPAGIDGKLNDGSTQPQPVQVVTASINGQPAVVQSYNEAPGLVAGVMTVTVVIPPGATTGDLVLHIGGNDSQPGVTVFIQ